jgi:hypothetical protein
MGASQSIIDIAKQLLGNDTEDSISALGFRLSTLEREVLVDAAKQIASGRGFDKAAPLAGIGSFGFYTFSRFCGFRVLKLDTIQHNLETMDEIQLQHSNGQSQCKMYNRIEPPKKSMK